MMFPDRAPDDQYLYTTFIGGNRNRDLAGASTYSLCAFQCFTCRGLLVWFISFKSKINLNYLLYTLRDKLMPVVKSDLKRLLGVEGEPTFVKWDVLLLVSHQNLLPICLYFWRSSIWKSGIIKHSSFVHLTAGMYTGPTLSHCITGSMTQF